jgi:hypothetical protein
MCSAAPEKPKKLDKGENAEDDDDDDGDGANKNKNKCSE